MTTNKGSTGKKTKNRQVKESVKNRMVNRGHIPSPGGGAPPTEQDVKRRLGNFTGTGEHARVGGRRGIVGQSKSTFRTSSKLPARAKNK